MRRRAFLTAATAMAAAGDLLKPCLGEGFSRYIFFHGRTPRESAASGFAPERLLEIPRAIGQTGSPRLRLGAAFTFNILEQPPEQLLRSVSALLDSAKKSGVPVFPCLDGENWWESRSDLWNWWDPKRPGYNPANRQNVEWYGWGPEFAVKIGWRNWGRQIRVAPAPNLASAAVLAGHERAYRVLIPAIAQWYSALPPSRRYLFGGLKVGWEASINVNAYYYPDGNAIFERNPADPSGDPQYHNASHGWTFGTAPLGYAAVSASAVKRSGELQKEDLEGVVHGYLRRLCQRASELGIPRSLIFTHQGGTYAPWERHLSFRPGINEYSIPGYSFYSHDPQDCGSLDADLAAAGRPEWAAVEWLRGSRDAAGWALRLNRTLDFRSCRLLSIYNWDNFSKAPGALDGIRAVLESRSRA